MAGMKKSYLYMALAEGIVAMRVFACWCPACMQAVGRGVGSLDSSLKCTGCISPHLTWQERSCARKTQVAWPMRGNWRRDTRGSSPASYSVR
jgi:hypothetical protein